MLEMRRRSIRRGARPSQRGAAPYLVHERLVVILHVVGPVVAAAIAVIVMVMMAVLGQVVVNVLLLLLLLHGQFGVQLVHKARL